ncbi:hypothetical protein LOS78_17415 [Paracoccus sp. MA]|uniref:hypothetical protein n=1 Tax=Paracoccus sp. MA TaxID=2895796 RepID=UPI001E52636A|nr:hypothetical protein [Paracoccus sp. MA]UFM65413.1 hypothetical protein LOS78_17415 [Paracoccus sp. MA]
MSLLPEILCFLLGLWLGRRSRRAHGRRHEQPRDEWLAYGQGTGIHVRRDSRRADSPGRIYLHSPP